ncbi:MAG: hypothetical protein K0R09_1369 [Clostridiales bacterium]|nr:hypothetical protein [Clostridiales bacterium]
MGRRIYSAILVIIFITITAFQFNLNYESRQQPPSELWSKEVLVSKGEVGLYNYPKLVDYNNGYTIAHDDADKIKVVILDNMGNKLNEKVFDAENKSVKDVNLLTDGEYLYVNWIVHNNSIDNILNMKLDKNLNLVEKWITSDVSESNQIGENIMIIAYNNRIEVQDVKSKKVVSVNAPVPSKLSGTATKYGYMITYYVPYGAGIRDINGFFNFFVKDGVGSKPVNIMERPTSATELFLNTATACDDKNGYIIVERRNKENFSNNVIITFPIGSGPGDMSTAGEGREKEFQIQPTDQFIYSPGSISSGDEARFIIGYARKFGRTTRQFNLMDFSLKDGNVTKTAYATRTRQASNAPYSNGDMIVYSSLVKGNEYNIFIASQNEGFKQVNNGVRVEEVRLALVDMVLEILNAIFSMFTFGLRWLIPGFVLISLMSMFGYKLNLRGKRAIYIIICIIGTAFKLYSVHDYYYDIYFKQMPEFLRSVYVGIGISLLISVFSYLFGCNRYFSKLKIDEDAFPFICFALALLVDSLLTQLVFTPFVM